MNKNAEHIKSFALKNLKKEILDTSGSFIYSSAETLRKGKIYFLGMNPGGDPKHESEALRKGIKDFPGRKENAFFDECWGGCLQGNAKRLFDEIGVCLKEVCYSNLIFTRSRSIADLESFLKKKNLSFEDAAEICWTVHKEILRIVQPKLILVHGNKTKSFFEKKGFVEKNCKGSDHGDSKWYEYKGKVDKKDVALIIFPHLRRYSATAFPKSGLVKRIKGFI